MPQFISDFIPKDCATNGGPSPNVPCVFPFLFNGTLYNQCAPGGDGYWCSTKVDSSGEHIVGEMFWGTCSEGCPGANQGM